MKVVTHPHAIHALKRNVDVIHHLHQLGKEVRMSVVKFSPIRTGHYVRSLFVMKVSGADPHIIVGATDFKAWWIEFGAFNAFGAIPPQAPLRRALIAHRMKWVGIKKKMP